uniref:AlNc14C151G7537 protein n=1 Tax=Albugo laibachii Nc14 TaxID=890382 RepID=F0WM26_9STRA|nr:AlNc14C151G7537 [Albugo laibachii Nc14]|eukprot:CCA22353.1 AlNc14C151G7537 [Albugo laibachii Nc14]
MYDQKGKVDPSRFRLCKEKNSVMMYRESRTALVARLLQCRPSVFNHHKVVQAALEHTQKPQEAPKTSLRGPMDQLENVASLPIIIALGSVCGTLEETMMGVSLRDRASYCSLVSPSHKKVLVARLLANLPNPAVVGDKHHHMSVH